MLNNKTYNFSDLIGRKIYAKVDAYIYKNSSDKKPYGIVKANKLFGVLDSFKFVKSQNTWWFIFKDKNGILFGIPSKNNAFPQIKIDVLTDSLINAGVKSVEQLSEENKKAYDKSPIDAFFNSVSSFAKNTFGKYGVWIAGAGVAYAIFLHTNKNK